MITVIIAGGSGTRLWPLSTPGYPKHLLKLTGERTLLQIAYDRASRIGNLVYVVTEASHAHHVRAQLPELPEEAFLIEPGRRGTAHCIVFALDVISRVHGRDESIAFIHSDHYIQDISGFVGSFATADRIARSRSSITLIGVQPIHPSTGMGYIKRGKSIDADSHTYEVTSFKEKPNHTTALAYLQSGDYLWNCGYFVGLCGVFLKDMKTHAPALWEHFQRLESIDDTHSDHYRETYLAFDSQTIDLALIEKVRDLAVIAADFDWMDVGTFKDLHSAVSRDEDRNYLHGEAIYTIDVTNAYIRNEGGRPVAVIGLDNIVVVSTPEGVLVTSRDVSHRTGEIAKKIQADGDR